MQLTRFFCSILILFLLLGASSAASAAEASQPQATRDAILVLDASGSMWARMDGQPQITVAKKVIRDLLDDLPASTRLGLVSYGHRRKGDCSDIETLVEIGEGRDAIRAALEGISPKGKTPMTAAVKQAAEALKYTENQATVILVSDGKETCGMDPCEVASRLEELGVDLTVHAIGFGMQDGAVGLAQVRCLAENTGGRFFAANNASELATALQEVSEAEPTPPTTVKVTLHATDQKDGPRIEKGLLWTVRHGASDDVLYQSQGTEGTVEIELPRGVHKVHVERVADEAQADGEIETGTNGTTVTVPILMELSASLDAPATAVAGEHLVVTWEGPDRPDDYIGVFEPDAAVRDDLHYTRTREGNPLKLKLPETPGTYELRYVQHNPRKVLARRSIEVTQVSATLDVPATAVAGETVAIPWTGPDYKDDYIGVFKPDAGNRDDIHYRRTYQGNPAQLKMPEEAGTYEVRYVLNTSRKDLARSTITVTPVSATLDVPATAVAGETVTIPWTGPGYKDDYIGVFKPDAGNRGDIHYRRTYQGNPAQLKMPQEPGIYEIRYVLNSSRRDLVRKTITVTAASGD